MSYEHIRARSVIDGFRQATERMQSRGFRVSAGSYAEGSSVFVFSVATAGPGTYNASRHVVDVLIETGVDQPFLSIQDTAFSV